MAYSKFNCRIICVGRSTITEHINNILKSGELETNIVGKINVDNFKNCVEKFVVLRKIGVDEQELNKALFKQIGIFFMFPLILAIIHSIFGVMLCNNILKTMGVSFNLKSVIITSLFIIFIYGGYFFITYLCSKNIIKEK